jgi:hypothetical protein
MAMKTRSLKILKVGGATPLVARLNRLKTQFGATAIKLSTEDAAMSLDQIRFWMRLCRGVVPVLVKIGGPNARNDIKQLLAEGVDGLIAPMVESAYGLENFFAAIRDYSSPIQMAGLKKQINIETVTAVEKLEEILASREAESLDEITIGCSDLSKSLKKARMDPEVRDLVCIAIDKIRRRNISISVGGGISPATIDEIVAEVQPDQFNTRVITFQVREGRSYRSAVEESLLFELEMLKNDVSEGFLSRDEERFRARELKNRLQ